MNPQDIYICSHDGTLYRFTWSESELIPLFSMEDRGMGIFLSDSDLFISDKSNVYKLNQKTNAVLSSYTNDNRRLDFHHINIIENSLMVTCTGKDEIWIFNPSDLTIKSKINILDLWGYDRSISLSNFNDFFHINTICKYRGKYYIDVNHYYGLDTSGIFVLDENFNKLEEFELGWSTHGFSIIGEEKFYLCGKSWKNLDNPGRAGLMVEGELVFEHDPDKIFCKDFSVDNNFIYIVGGSVSKRDGRSESIGYLFLLDKSNFKLLRTFIFPEFGQFGGCTLLGLDFTKYSHNR